MAEITNTHNGTRRGKLGATVTVNRRGKVYERLAPVGNRSNTPQQQKQRSKFRVAIKAFSRLSQQFTIGFDRVSQPGCMGYNTGLGHNMSLALRQNQQDWQVDWNLVEVSCGTLANVTDIQIAPLDATNPDSRMQLTWNPNIGTNAYQNDLLYLALYNTRLQLPLWLIKGNAERKDLIAPLPAIPLISDPDTHFYLFTKRAKTNHVSTSTHFRLPSANPTE